MRVNWLKIPRTYTSGRGWWWWLWWWCCRTCVLFLYNQQFEDDDRHDYNIYIIIPYAEEETISKGNDRVKHRICIQFKLELWVDFSPKRRIRHIGERFNVVVGYIDDCLIAGRCITINGTHHKITASRNALNRSCDRSYNCLEKRVSITSLFPSSGICTASVIRKLSRRIKMHDSDDGMLLWWDSAGVGVECCVWIRTI